MPQPIQRSTSSTISPTIMPDWLEATSGSMNRRMKISYASCTMTASYMKGVGMRKLVESLRILKSPSADSAEHAGTEHQTSTKSYIKCAICGEVNIVPTLMMPKSMVSVLLEVAMLPFWMVLLLSYVVLSLTACAASVSLILQHNFFAMTTLYVRWLVVWAIVFGLSGFAVIIGEAVLQSKEKARRQKR